MVMASNRVRNLSLAGVLIVVMQCLAPARAKVEEGTLKLDSLVTEQLIGKFGVADTGELSLKLTTSKSGWERGSHQLHVMLFHEESYNKWTSAIKKGSLCQDRNKLADVEKAIDMPHQHATHTGHGWEYFTDPDTGESYRINNENGKSEWAHPDNHTQGPLDLISHRETEFHHTLEHYHPTGRGRNPSEKVAKATYWYVVMSDCALEFYEAHPPPMHYHLTVLNAGSHLPDDLSGIGGLYWLLLAAMSAALVPGSYLVLAQYRRLGRIHVLTVAMAVAYVLQTTALALELAHLAVFSRDGKGLQWRHTVFAADFVAEVMQGVSELITALLLLFLACGWTTVSLSSVGARLLGSLESGTGSVGGADSPFSGGSGDLGEEDFGGGASGGTVGLKKSGVMRRMTKQVPVGIVAVVKGLIDDDDPEVKRRVAAVTRALQQPATLMGAGGHSTGKAREGMGVGTVLVFALAATQLFLEMASRGYTEDFSGFHDHEHWPGYCLVLLRLVLAGLFAVGGRTALQAAEMQDADAAKFLRRLRKVGAVWMLAFPGLVMTAWLLPALWRHRYVTGGLAVLQSAALLGLAYITLMSEAFLSVSSVAPRSASSAGNVLGVRGMAAKLAVD